VRQPYVVPRRRLLFAVWLTVVALPILAIDNIPRTDARAASVTVVAPDAIDPPTTAASATSQTTEPASTTDAPATGAPPATRAPTTTTTKPMVKAPPPTTVPKTVAPPTTAPPPANEEEGGASWYAYNPGQCAHPTIPKGTVVTVTRLSTGASVTCVVTDRGPTSGGRIIDLDRSTFAQLADPSAGVIEVRITW
jgi:rare lipoprotein A (peptidoglycan hydrolase)